MSGVIYIKPRSGDRTEDIQQKISRASRENKKLVFLDGEYQVSGAIELHEGVDIESQSLGGAILASKDSKSATLTLKTNADNGESNLKSTVKGFLFDNVAINMSAGEGTVTIAENAFIRVKAKYWILADKGRFNIRDNVLLADKEVVNYDWVVKDISSPNDGTYLVGIRTQELNDSVIEGNMIGGTTSREGFNSYHDDWKINLARVAADLGGFELHEAGYFSTGMNIQRRTTRTTVRGNTIVGAKEAKGLDFDHAIYALRFDDLKIVGNYIHGWPKIHNEGQVKIRNGKNLTFNNNVLDEASLQLFANEKGNIDELYAENWKIFDNEITSYKTPIYYFERTLVKNGNGSYVNNLQIHDNTLNNLSDKSHFNFRPTVDPNKTNDYASNIIFNNNYDRDGNRATVYTNAAGRYAVTKTWSNASYTTKLTNIDLPDANDYTLKMLVPEKKTFKKGTSGNDKKKLSNGSDFYRALDGDDKINARKGNDVIYGGKGNDIVYGHGGSDILVGGEGNDKLFGDHGNDTLYGGDSKDMLYGGIGKDVFLGGNGADKIFGGRDNDILFGGSDHDKLLGGSGDDILLGESGDDILVGGKGQDVLVGGSGKDIFLFESGVEGLDQIVDFERGVDKIDLRKFSISYNELSMGIIDGNLSLLLEPKEAAPKILFEAHGVTEFLRESDFLL